jgi:hypothetical protein
MGVKATFCFCESGAFFAGDMSIFPDGRQDKCPVLMVLPAKKCAATGLFPSKSWIMAGLFEF